MFGDVFQRAGNFFTGSGWVSDDEKRRKQKQQAQQQQAQAQKQVQQQGVPFKAAGASQQPPQQSKTILSPFTLKPNIPNLDTKVNTSDLVNRTPSPVQTPQAAGQVMQSLERKKAAAPSAPPAPMTNPQASIAPLLIKRTPAPKPAPIEQPKLVSPEEWKAMDSGKQAAYINKIRDIADRNKLDMGNQESAKARIAAENIIKTINPDANKKFDLPDFLGGMVKGFAQGVTSPFKSVINTAQEIPRRDALEKLAREGKISVDDYNRNLKDIYDGSIVTRVKEGKGQLTTRDTNPLEFAQKFGGEGLDFALNVAAPETKGIGITKDVLKEALKVGGIYGVGQNVADVANKRDVSPESIISNFATGGLIGGLGHLLPGAFKPKETRQADKIQTAIEQANNKGDMTEVSRLIDTLPEDLKLPMKSALGLEKPKIHLDGKTGKIVYDTPQPAVKTPDPEQPKLHQDNVDLALRDAAEAADSPSLMPDGTSPKPELPTSRPVEQPPVETPTPPELQKIAQNVDTQARQEVIRISQDTTLTPEQKTEQIQTVVEGFNRVNQAIKDNVAKTSGQVDVAGQQLKTQADAATQAATESKAVEAAKTEPVGQVDNPPVPSRGELGMNNAYKDYANDLLAQSGHDVNKKLVGKGNNIIYNPVTRGIFGLQQKGVKVIDKAREKTSEAIQSGLQSGNKVNAGVLDLARLGFKNFGLSDANRHILTLRTSQLQNAGEVASRVYKSMEDAAQATGNPQATYKRIYQVLETPDFLQKVYGDPAKISINDLTPEERVAFDKLIEANKVRNKINFEIGIINRDQYAAYADGMHSPRIYDLEALGNPDFTTARYLNTKAGVKRKDITKISDAVTGQTLESPFHASSLRLESALKNKANAEALDNLAQAGLLLERAPNKNFVKLVGKKYGSQEGKFIDKQILSQIDNKEYFNTKVGQAVGDTVRAVRDSKFGAIDRMLKSFKTVLSPGTAGGNVGSNIFAFAGAANVNPATAAVRMAQAAKQLIGHKRGFDANVNRAEQAGLFSGDTGYALTGSKEAESAVKSGSTRNPYKIAQNLYSDTDKAFALGLFNELKARGLSDAEAVLRAQKATQNYANVGRGVSTLADSPVLGKPFARFTPELLRILKNNLLYNPVGSAAKIGGLATAGAYLSGQAGETEEERKARTGAVGQTELPFTGWVNNMVSGGANSDNVSLNLPVGDSAVNIARLTGLNYPIEPGGDASSALLRQLSPFADPTRKNAQGEEVIAPNQLVSSMFGREIADQVANRDFMGRQITDPENKIIYEDGKIVKTKYTPESQQQGGDMFNRLSAAAMAYLPFSNEYNAIGSALQGSKDYYGKERTVPEAIARVFGFKTEANDPQARKDRVDTQNYFDEKLPEVQGFLQNNPDLAADYFKINNPTKDRNTNVKESDLITPEKWDTINADTSGRLFNFMKQQAIKNWQADGKPLDPIYRLDPQQEKYVQELRSRPTGDDLEATEILRATQPWFNALEDAQQQYYTDNDAYYKAHPINGGATDSPRVLAYRAAGQKVEQPEIVKQYYAIKGSDPVAAKSFYKANVGALSPAFNDYAAARLNRVNTLRAIEGYAPIEPEVFANKTFGFDMAGGGSGGGGYSRSYGGGGGGGSSSYYSDQNLLPKLSDISVETPLAPIKPKDMPALMAIFQKAMAGGGSGRAKAKIGAAATGR